MESHQPVLLAEVIEALAIQRDGVYLDCTTGLGGHSREIVMRLGPAGKLICRDRDGESLAKARANLARFADRILWDQGPFSTLTESLARKRIARVNGLLADLGVSLYQLTSPERGFSFQHASDLDMRMDRSGSEGGPTAADIVNFWSEQELARILFELGGERRARRISRAIVRARPVRSTQSLASVIEQAAPRMGRLHPATLTFQGLRIAVNREMEELTSLLDQVPTVLAPGGRAVVITFHSLESRLVKKKFQELARQGRARLLTKHVVTPSQEETRSNPASRSAMLRTLELL